MAAHLGFIQHVVVNQRGGVDHLDGSGKRVVSGHDLAASLRGEQEQGRAEPLAAVVLQVLDQRAEWGTVLGERCREDAVGFFDVRGHRTEQRSRWA